MQSHGGIFMNYEKTAVRVSKLSIIGNILLTLFKLLAGIAARSGAMVSDAVHSASDVFSSIIVIIGVKYAQREADEDHPYGHERYECVASIVLAIILLVTGLFIAHNAIEKLLSGEEIAVPGRLALLAAIVSILVKEAMFRYTAMWAKRIGSDALMAEAYHHRSDALSSIGALIGIGGAIMGYVRLDALASIVICGFIVKAAYDIFADAIGKMVDSSCGDELEQAMRECVLSGKGVMGIDSLSTRRFGNKVYADIEISADGELSLYESHKIAENVHDSIEQNFPEVKHIMVHVNPYKNGV